jgi:hypothetical protein
MLIKAPSASPHGVVLEAMEPEDLALQEMAKNLQIAKRVKG